MNYLAHTVQAEQFFIENEDFIYDVLMENNPIKNKGHVSLNVNENYELVSVGFDKCDRRKHKYIKLNSKPILKNSPKKVILAYIEICYEGEKWWHLKRFLPIRNNK